MRWPFKRPVRATLLSLGLVVAASSTVACNLPFGGPIAQGGGLPTLYPLDWGFPYNEEALWSPDGRWIAVSSGSDISDAHLEVVSPDGHERHNLASWGCTDNPSYDFAWLPDSGLACIQDSDRPYQMCIGAAPFAACTAVPLPGTFETFGEGAAWTPEGTELLLAASTALPAGGFETFTDLYVLSPTGRVIQMLPFNDQGGIYFPTWVPHAQAISYLDGKDSSDLSPLVESTVTRDAAGHLMLGPPHTLATGQTDFTGQHAWSPSGRWVAVRLEDPGDDHIALVNAANPAQTLDVTSDGAMTNPIWSPDGQMLIVFQVGYAEQKPYSVAIGAYLRSKGLEP